MVLVGLNLIPLTTSLLAAFTGAALFVPEGQITVDFDAQVRVYGLRFTAILFLSLWMAFKVEACGPMLKIVFSLVALACALRIYAMFAMGEFPISTLIGAIVEIAMLGFIPWHRHIPRRTAGARFKRH